MPERHVTIARSEEDYISFPDVCLTRGSSAPWPRLACDPNPVLCEVSRFRMPDGSLRAFLRENSARQEPTDRTSSFDEGASWTPVRGTPMIGHRPCAGLLRGGKVLITHRHVGLDGGNRARIRCLNSAGGRYSR